MKNIIFIIFIALFFSFFPSLVLASQTSYVRVVELSCWSSAPQTSANLAELWAFDASGVNVVSGGIASASSSLPDYPASLAFDGNNSSSWWISGSPGFPAWVQYQFSSVVDVVQVKLGMYIDADNQPKDYEVQFSMDGQSWETVAVGQMPQDAVGPNIHQISGSNSNQDIFMKGLLMLSGILSASLVVYSILDAL